MTFFGEYRGTAEAHEESDTIRRMATARWRTRHGHGHGGIHESPRLMVVPLVVLALLSVTGGWIGVPGSLGGSNRFEKFLGAGISLYDRSGGAEGHGLRRLRRKKRKAPSRRLVMRPS